MNKPLLFGISSILVAVTFTVVYLCYFFGAFDSTDGGGKTQKFVICFFTSWAQYRDGEGRIQAKDIDPRLCTHITYTHLQVTEHYHFKELKVWMFFPCAHLL